MSLVHASLAGGRGPLPIRAVVLDLFDTLVDLRAEDLPQQEFEGQRVPASAWKVHALVAERVPVDFGRFNRAVLEGIEAFGKSHFAQDREVTTLERFSDALVRLGIEDPELAERMTLAHMGVLRSAVRIPEHHVAVLDALRKQVRIGLCSNFSHTGTALAILAEAGLADRLDAVVVSDTFGWRKPRAEIFEEVVCRLGARPDEVLHVGDSLRADVAGAAAAGLRTAWITRRVRDVEEALARHAGPPPDHVIADLAELTAIVESSGG